LIRKNSKPVSEGKPTMNQRWLRLLQGYLWVICAFHVITGLGVNFSRPFIDTMADWYGAKVDFTPQFLTILHPLGAFMFILGVLAAVAARDPLRYRPIVYSFAALFLIRSLQRVLFQQDIEQAFQIAPTRNLLNMGLFLVMAITLTALQLHVERHQVPAVR
jgi:hypothetical protein